MPGGQVQVFVRRVDRVIGQADSSENGLHTQDFLHDRCDGDTAAFAFEDHVFLPGVFESLYKVFQAWSVIRKVIITKSV